MSAMSNTSPPASRQPSKSPQAMPSGVDTNKSGLAIRMAGNVTESTRL